MILVGIWRAIWISLGSSFGVLYCERVDILSLFLRIALIVSCQFFGLQMYAGDAAQ